MAEYSQGVCGDGAAILRDGQRMTVDEIVAELNAADAVRKERAALYLRARDWAEVSGRMEAERDALQARIDGAIKVRVRGKVGELATVCVSHDLAGKRVALVVLEPEDGK